MAQYLILIYEEESRWATAAPPQGRQIMDDYIAFGQRNESSIDGGNALQPTSTATSLRRDASGELVVTDGPYVETKEALGGYYLISADNLDEAIAIAQQVPAVFGGVEIRPIRTFD